LIDAAHELRYQVYCVEHAFLDRSNYCGEREIDRYDRHSAHAVLVYRPTRKVVGCVRLILPGPDDGLSSLPIRALLTDEGRARLDRWDRATTAEISRYAVSKIFRHRQGEDLYPDVHPAGRPGYDFRRVAPHVSLGLVRAVATLAAERGITTVCAAMTPALRRLLEMWGLNFQPLGPVVDYHGQRQPCVADCEALLTGMATRHAEYYRIVDAAYHRGTDRD
jgi:N-acyl amino acid synthase of PEP-CTERM/exosortase system